MDVCENKLSVHNIPKKYLTSKTFSYKLYLNLCYISFWSYDRDIDDNMYIEYKLREYSLKEINKITGLSINTIKDRLSKLPYRDKFDSEQLLNGELMDNYRFRRKKHLYFNSPRANYTKVSLEVLSKLVSLDEFDIRLYIFIYGYMYDTIRGLTQKDILDMIGLSSKSHNNFTKLTNSTNKLKELGLLDFKVESDGIKKYIIYYKK